MNLNIDKATSRPLGVAQKLVKHPIDESEVYSKVVVLTGEHEVLATPNGRWCFLDALALLSRIVGNLTVILPAGTTHLEAEVENFCARAWGLGSLRVVRDGDPMSLESSDAILCIGTQARPSLPWTVVNSNGWVARVSSGTLPLPSDLDQPNALGALMAASLGVTEVFKRIFGVPHDVAPLLEKTEFSLFDQTTTPTWIGPPLPKEIRIPDTLLVGAGAIGNGIALLFSQLPFRGRIHVVDKQDYADENLSTCILLELEGWLGQPKATRLATWMRENSNLDVTGEKGLIETAKSGPEVSGLAIDLVLNGLDDVEARRETQDLWPSIIIDGGINEIGAAVVQHRLDQKQLACLKCWFEPQKIDARLLQSQLTGLNIASLIDTGRLLTEEDIAQAVEGKRDSLRERKREGKTLCSIISEKALATKLGVEAQEGFKPSVPFVATAAAAMVVAEAVKALAFPEMPVASMFQIASLFLGPEESAQRLYRLPSASCNCVVHRKMIDQLHDKRKKGVRIL